MKLDSAGAHSNIHSAGCLMKTDIRNDLLDQVSKVELKISKKKSFDPEVLSTLESLLLDVHATLLPKPNDYEKRRHLVEVYQKILLDTFGNKDGFPVVKAFGSFIMDIFTSCSDLDLSINFSNEMIHFPRDKKISILRRLSKVLYAHQRRGLVTGVMPILKARVPVLKAVDRQSQVECDISVENKDGFSRSIIFSIIASIDERFRILCFLMKVWAKTHDINSSKDHTINSLSIISLVAFHLQTRNPPILPPFSVLLKDGTYVSSIESNVAGFKRRGNRNQESVAELFLSLLNKLSSVQNLWECGLCASTYEGSWIIKEWKSGVGNMSVEDFLDRSENFARSVGKVEMQKIYKCIEDSLSNVSLFTVGQITASRLKELLFGLVELKAPNDNKHANNEIKQRKRSNYDTPASAKPPSTKRPRHSERTRELDHSQYRIPIVPPPVVLPPVSVPIQLQASNGLYSSGFNFVPLQSAFGSQFHLGHPVVSYHPGYGLHNNQQYSFVPQLRYNQSFFPSQPDSSTRYNPWHY